MGVLMSVSQSFAQYNKIGDVLAAGQADANIIAGEYLRPFGEMMGVNLNSGWYNSAKVHKLGGFDLTIMGTYTMAPSSKESFNPKEVGLSAVTVPQSSSAPTMAGPGSASTDFSVGGQKAFTLKGSDQNSFVTPMIQGAVGLPFHTEIMARFMPEVEYGDLGKAYMWGVGAKHSLKDYIPFVKRVPFLELSLLAAYTHFDGSLAVESASGKGSLATMSNAYTGRVLVGANFPVVCFYTGFGYGNANTDFDLTGDYKVTGFDDASHPIDLSYSTGQFDFNAGMRVRLGVIALHADYTVGDYSAVTVGLGLNFR